MQGVQFAREAILKERDIELKDKEKEVMEQFDKYVKEKEDRLKKL